MPKIKNFDRYLMKRIAFLLVALATVAGLVAFTVPASGHTDEAAAPIFGITIPPGYRDWKLISVAHEAGNNNDLRAVLGNEVAIQAYRDGKLPFPDGTIIARLAWSYLPSEENNKVFGRDQSWVAGPPINAQFMVKDSKKYAATGGWGFAQFKDGKPDETAQLKTCFPCHEPAKARDFVFTQYAPTP
jgi:cytochrome P460